MECTRKEVVNEVYEIHVCCRGPGPDRITTYERLRFALQASSWFPPPLGIVLWCVLHVLLLVGGAPLLLLVALTTIVLSALLDIILLSVWLPLWLLRVLLWYLFAYLAIFFNAGLSFVRCCWSLINRLLQQIRDVCNPNPEGRSGHTSREDLQYPRYPADEYTGRTIYLCDQWFELPWCTLSVVEYLVEKGFPSWYFRVLTRWCAEVVHSHDAIAI